MQWLAPLGAPGAATGAIAIGTVATSTSTTIITLIKTTILIETSTGDRADKVTGSIIRNTVGTLLTATEEQQTGSVVRVPAELAVVAASAEPAVQVGLAELAAQVAQVALAGLDVPVAQVELEALAELEDQVVPAVRAALVVQENQVAPVGLVASAEPVVQVELAELVASAELVNQEAPVVLAGRVAPAGLELAPVAVLVRTKSVIAAHRRGQVPVPRVEDLRAAAETMHAPAAAEAEKAWAAAVTAAAEADEAVVE